MNMTYNDSGSSGRNDHFMIVLSTKKKMETALSTSVVRLNRCTRAKTEEEKISESRLLTWKYENDEATAAMAVSFRWQNDKMHSIFFSTSQTVFSCWAVRYIVRPDRTHSTTARIEEFFFWNIEMLWCKTSNLSRLLHRIGERATV